MRVRVFRSPGSDPIMCTIAKKLVSRPRPFFQVIYIFQDDDGIKK